MGLNRRTFLHQSTWRLLTLGMSQSGVALKWECHARSLVADTPRKLALLMGIDNYGASSHDLQGCTTLELPV